MNKNYENYKEWTGNDVDMTNALICGTFVIRYNSEHNNFDVIYLAGFDEEGAWWDYTSFDFEGTIQDLEIGYSWMKIEDVIRYSGIKDKDAYLEEVDVLHLLEDLCGYYGVQVFGDSYNPYHTKDISEDLGLSSDDVEYIDAIYRGFAA